MKQSRKLYWKTITQLECVVADQKDRAERLYKRRDAVPKEHGFWLVDDRKRFLIGCSETVKDILIKSFIVLVVLRRSVQRVCGGHLRAITPASNTALLEKMSQRWRDDGNTVYNLRPAAREKNALSLDHLAGFKRYYDWQNWNRFVKWKCQRSIFAADNLPIRSTTDGLQVAIIISFKSRYEKWKCQRLMFAADNLPVRSTTDGLQLPSIRTL